MSIRESEGGGERDNMYVTESLCGCEKICAYKRVYVCM